MRRIATAAGMILVLAGLVSARAAPIDDFRYTSDQAAARAWVPSAQSPRPSALAEGVSFPCPFSRDLERVYWDRSIALDLSRATSLELDLACAAPHALRSFNVYLRSGAGWYVWGGPIPEPGRQRLLLMKSRFTTEGKPAGWHKIDLVRLSAWRGVPEDTAVVAYSLRGATDSILLVRNTISTPSASERSFAGKVLDRISGWLAEAGVAHGVVTDDDVVRGGLAGARVAILPYNPHPPAAELSALKRFVEAGGRLIVFYGADPGLAALMGVRLAAYRRAELPGQWAAFDFDQAAKWNVPECVYQDSTSVMPAFPANVSARVIAWWEDSLGRRTEEPAWLASEAGFWMTHVLLDDDGPAKQALLVGLLGSIEPSVWAQAAASALGRVGKIDSFPDFGATVAAIGAAADAASNPRLVRQLLAGAESAHAKLRPLYEEGRYQDVVRQCDALRARLVEAYGRVQPARPGEFRGVWEHDGVGWYPGDWRRTCRILSESGIDAIFPNMLWGGVAHYPSRILPPSASARQYGDLMEQCIEAAHRHGLQVHVWKVCWSLSGAPEEFAERMKAQGRLQVNAAGKTIPWLCPSNPDNRWQELSSLKEIAQRYAVDGLHLDYIRFAGSDACYCPACRAGFEKRLGRRVDWPRAVKPGGKYYGPFREWRTGRITSFVQAVREQVLPVRPGLKLSAAVFGSYPACVESMGQDWALWLEKGYVDFVCPMNYTADAARFATLTHAQLQLKGAGGRVYPGIGVSADESRLRADQAIEQVAALRRLGAPGFMLFDLGHALREETLPALSLGATRPE